jgi:hypothetical protein
MNMTFFYFLGGSYCQSHQKIVVVVVVCWSQSSDVEKCAQERHWSFPGMAAALQALMGSSPSQRLQHALTLTPSLLSVYFTIALRDVNDCKYPLTHNTTIKSSTVTSQMRLLQILELEVRSVLTFNFSFFFAVL